MRRCILHIGWHKTGSTALQHFLHSEATALTQHQVHYPTCHPNHSSFLPSAFSTESTESYSEAFVPPLEGYEDMSKREAARILVDEVFASGSDGTVLFSAEDLVLLDRTEVLRCYEELASKFDQIELIVYLRDHESYATSATQQLLRMGFGIAEIIQMATSGTAPIAVLEPLPHYAERLSNWLPIFGRDRVSIFSYNHLVERGESIQAHFLQDVVGIDEPAMLARANAWPRTNSSFSHPAAYVMNRVNAISPLFVDGHRNPGFQFNQQRLLADLSGPPFQAPAELLDALRSAHLSDIDELRALSDITMAPMQERSVFAGTATTLFSQDALLDEVADILSSSGAEALLGNARQKLFASMLGLRSSSSRALAVRQIHLARFLMADQINLISSANWLIGAGELELATNYLSKAEDFSTKPAGLTALQKRLVEALRSELPGSP